MADSFSRSILLCVSGMSPAVITETLYALVTQTPAFIPDEVHVVTTSEGKQKVLDALLNPDTGQFHQFLQDYLPGRSIRFDASTVHVIRQHRAVSVAAGPFAGLVPAAGAADGESVELSDITTDADNEAAANTVYRVMRAVKGVPGTRLHASVAGGRKSMSFYMGHVFSLMAETGDSLSHVLVNWPFEDPRLKFFYPPPVPRQLSFTDARGTQRTVSTADAHVQLAELSVLKLGGVLGQDWPEKAQHSFAFAVQLAQAALVTPELKVVLGSTDGRACGWLEVCGERIDPSPVQFTVFALYALACVHQDELPDGPQLMLSTLPAALWGALSQGLDGARFDESADFKSATSRAQDVLRAAVGPVARRFRIEAVGSKVKGGNRPSALLADPGRLKLVGLQGWWQALKGALA